MGRKNWRLRLFHSFYKCLYLLNKQAKKRNKNNTKEKDAHQNFLKKNKRYQDELVFTDNYLHPITNQDPAILIDAKQIAGLIRQLPAGYQTIFNLHAIEGYTHVEIGEMLGINDSTSRSQYARARALLISWIEKHSEDKKRNYVRK